MFTAKQTEEEKHSATAQANQTDAWGGNMLM
jgi:hypothetical protein